MKKWVRQLHRWVAVAFTVSVVVVTVVLATQDEPAEWVYLSPLLPLGLLFLTGAALFFQPLDEAAPNPRRCRLIALAEVDRGARSPEGATESRTAVPKAGSGPEGATEPLTVIADRNRARRCRARVAAY